MAVWAIGDIQGCFTALQGLLKKIEFNPEVDKLWIAGDIVNRGDGSLETLEYRYSIRHRVSLILGNHDMTLIATYYGLKKSNPTLDPILDSPHAKELIDWLRSQKFLHVDYTLGFCMSHAGIPPEFDLGMALAYSKRIEAKLQDANADKWLKKIFKGNDTFDQNSSNIDMDRYIVSAFTRMRYCHDDNKLDFEQKGKPTESLYQKGLKPWFESKNKKEIELKIIFGHWSTLGFYHNDEVLGLDTGCLWGKRLTAARIDKKNIKIVSFDCEGI